ncbi:MAG: triose-phosphate isomerase [Armatimonadota bacterium]
MRNPIMAGNWKMNCDLEEACKLACAVVEGMGCPGAAEVVLGVPATDLTTVVNCTKDSKVGVAAQNMFWEESGAYTGEISAKMILSTGAQWVIIGHSERRGRFGKLEEGWTPAHVAYFGDSDLTVNAKIKKALASGLKPIACCGELLSERQEGKADCVVAGQVKAMLEGICPCDIKKMVIAYEPVWAIGTGEVCDADEADRICGIVRQTVAEVAGAEVAEGMRVLYGGSVKDDNVVGLMAKPNIDGGLVGGASLKAAAFIPLIVAAKASVA